MEKQLLSPVSNLVISSLNNHSPAASRHGALVQLPWAGDTLTGLLEGLGQMGSHESLAPQSSPHPSCLLGPPSRFTLSFSRPSCAAPFSRESVREKKIRWGSHRRCCFVCSGFIFMKYWNVLLSLRGSWTQPQVVGVGDETGCLGIQFNSILTLVTRRRHQTPQVKGLGLQNCLSLSLQMPDASLACHLYFFF